MPHEGHSIPTCRVSSHALHRLGLLALVCLVANAPAFAGPLADGRDSRRAALMQDQPDARVVQAALGVYRQGMTEELAEELVGREGLGTLKTLLADPGFPRHDNVVALIACLDDGEATDDLLRYLRRPPTDGLSAEQDRALLLAPEALGHIAARGDQRALDALLDMSAPGSPGRLLVAAARAADAPAATHRALLASALRGLARSNTAAGLDRLSDLALGEPGPFNARGSLVHQASGALLLRAQLDRAEASPPASETRNRSGNWQRQDFDHASHASLTKPMTSYRRDALLESVALRLRRDSAPCCDGQLEPVGASFGRLGDGLDIVDDETELQAVLEEGSASIRVVRAINWCAAPGTNLLVCEQSAGTVVVRLSTLSDEAQLWSRR